MFGLDAIVFLMMTAVLLALAAWGCNQLLPAGQISRFWQENWPWFAKGFAAPALLWLIINWGVSFHVPPFFPRVQIAQLKGLPWFGYYSHVVAGGFVVIAAMWAAFTILTQLLPAYRNLQPQYRFEFHAVCFTSFAIMTLPALGLLIYAGWLSLGFSLLLLAIPIAHYGGEILSRPKPRPIYSRALARLKRGNYSEAEAEILRQLEKTENDFDGWMMLAELHATHFKELPEAEKIVLDICLDPKATPSQISVALHKLADWQIQLAEDLAGAARSLQFICDRLPSTHLAHMAELRRAQLPTLEELHARREGRPIAVPHTMGIFELTQLPPPLQTDPDEALHQVQHLTEALNRNPNSVTERESLARLLADPLGKPELAAEQIQLLLELPETTSLKRLEWLTLLAAWQTQLLRDEHALAATLKRLIQEYPHSAQAFAAQARLKLLQPSAQQPPS